ncbi:MAG: SET domain-containing protein-lysine N-methyltransferase [Sandaracinaceae bacterium]|nr:SET domain-containing protein-lysine N-methyltransferase [Sandaracinaceae bacterium]
MPPRVCVLSPAWADSTIDYRSYDPPRDLSRLWPEADVTHVALHKATVYRQLRALRREGFDVYVNLCEGYLDWDVPSIDVIHSLEALELPYTGPSAALYDPPKHLMKRVAFYADVAVPEHVLARTDADVEEAARALRFPLFVKPDRGGDSLGIDASSRCEDAAALRRVARRVMDEFDEVIIDEYVDGRELSVLVAAPAEPGGEVLALRPVEFVFSPDEPFKTYELKTTRYLPERNVPCDDPALDRALRDAARAVFRAFGGVGYARMDFRVGHDGTPRLLDVNFACSIFYGEGAYGTADYILMHDGMGQAAFLRHVVAEGIARHRARQPLYEVFRSPRAGLGIRAKRAILRGEVVFRGEERAQRLATRRHVETRWSAEDALTYRRYAYPVSDEVRILWDADPAAWAPQNHSCDPSTAYDGLDVVALRDLAPGEELTLDYASFCDEGMEPFACRCGAARCRGTIAGATGNSVDRRERARREGA